MGGAKEGRLHHRGASTGGSKLLGYRSAGPDEELGAGGGEGSACPQSARSPGAEARCDRVRCMRSW